MDLFLIYKRFREWKPEVYGIAYILVYKLIL